MNCIKTYLLYSFFLNCFVCVFSVPVYALDVKKYSVAQRSEYCEVETWTDPIYKSCVNDNCDNKRNGEIWTGEYETGYISSGLIGPRYFSDSDACRGRHADFIRAESHSDCHFDMFRRCYERKFYYKCLIPTYIRDSCPNVKCGIEVDRKPNAYKACQHAMHKFDSEIIRNDWNVSDANKRAFLKVLILINENRERIGGGLPYLINKLEQTETITYLEANKLKIIAELLERSPENCREEILSKIWGN